MTLRRVGLFGGTFDPPHLAHLALAEHCLRALSLDRVEWIPCGQPALKGRASAPPEHRRAMVELIIAGRPEFVVNDLELRREGTSYTVDTLAAVAEAWPGVALWWLMGLDALRDFPRWRQPERILSLARLAVVDRPGDESAEVLATLPAWVGERLDWVPMPPLDIASRRIRADSSATGPSRAELPDSVADYIAKHRLYTGA